MTESMIERCARAICNRHGRNYDAMLERNKDWWREEARAVLEAMAEPTPEMVEHGVSEALSTGVSGYTVWSDYIGDIWRAMITASLEASNEGGRDE